MTLSLSECLKECVCYKAKCHIAGLEVLTFMTVLTLNLNRKGFCWFFVTLTLRYEFQLDSELKWVKIEGDTDQNAWIFN